MIYNFYGDKIDFNIEICDKLSLKTDGNFILIDIKEKKFTLKSRKEFCIFCNCEFDLVKNQNLYICIDCINKLKNTKAGDYIY